MLLQISSQRLQAQPSVILGQNLSYLKKPYLIQRQTPFTVGQDLSFLKSKYQHVKQDKQVSMNKIMQKLNQLNYLLQKRVEVRQIQTQTQIKLQNQISTQTQISSQTQILIQTQQRSSNQMQTQTDKNQLTVDNNIFKEVILPVESLKPNNLQDNAYQVNNIPSKLNKPQLDQMSQKRYRKLVMICVDCLGKLITATSSFLPNNFFYSNHIQFHEIAINMNTSQSILHLYNDTKLWCQHIVEKAIQMKKLVQQQIRNKTTNNTSISLFDIQSNKKMLRLKSVN